ncbi:hypothetical protein T05_2955 [Trichinella murrelli]|uniref:Uncharacterized protein n=1 Tax=Trichinella murrelli TaxID=144512 RepID=A0A0V0TQS2_9BILA|nr:hypothetical protein T05_2955 [Trichinella murrelli]
MYLDHSLKFGEKKYYIVAWEFPSSLFVRFYKDINIRINIGTMCRNLSHSFHISKFQLLHCKVANSKLKFFGPEKMMRLFVKPLLWVSSKC